MVATKQRHKWELTSQFDGDSGQAYRKRGMLHCRSVDHPVWKRHFAAWPCGVLLALIVSSSAFGDPKESDATPMRTWTDVTGQFQTEAELLVVKRGKVYLRKPDGAVVAVPLERLSRADREHVGDVAPSSDTEAIDAARRATVLVTVQSPDGRKRVGPGVLIHVDSAGGYVVASSRLARSYRSQEPDGKPVIRVSLTGANGRRRAHGAELLGSDQEVGFSVLRVPPGEPPAPIPVGQGRRFAESEEISIVGYEVAATSGEEPTAQPVLRRGFLATIQYAESGRVERFEVRGDDVGSVDFGIVLDSSGRPMGISLPGQARPVSRASSVVLPFSRVVALRTPRLLGVDFDPKDWGPNGLRYRVTARFSDPFRRVARCGLSLKRWQGPLPDPVPAGKAGYQPAVAGMSALELERDSDQAAADWHDPDPPVTGHRPGYLVQFVSVAANGDICRSRAEVVRPEFTEHAKLSEIRSLLLRWRVQPSPDPRGGLSLTSEETKVVPQSVVGATPSVEIPRTLESGLAVAARPFHVRGARVCMLPGIKSLTEKGGVCTAWSADGRWLYTLGPKGTLRKIKVPEFREVARVELGETMASLALSSEGFVAAGNTGANSGLWIVDADTLRVKRRVPTTCRCVATSPALSVAYCAEPGLAVVDLAQGRVLHRLGTATDTSSRSYSAPRLEALRCTGNGKWLFGTCMGRIVRFSLIGEHVVYSGASEKINPRPGMLCLTADSQLVIAACMPKDCKADGHPSFEEGICVYRADDLSAPMSAFPLKESPVGLAVDPVSKEVITTQSEDTGGRFSTEWFSVERYSASGERTGRVGGLYGGFIDPRNLPAVACHPRGGALLVQTPICLAWLMTDNAPDDLQTLPEAVVRCDPKSGMAVQPGADDAPPADFSVFRETPDWMENAPQPVAEPRSFVGPWQDAEGMKISRFEAKEPIVSAVWSADGDWVHLLDKECTLYKVSVEDWKQTAALRLPGYGPGAAAKAGAMTRCKEGLVLRLWPSSMHRASPDRSAPTLFLVDERSLRIKRAFFVRLGDGLTASEKSSVCFVVNIRGEQLATIDMAAGKLLRHDVEPDLARRLFLEASLGVRADSIGMDRLRMTPDGRYLFARQSSVGPIARFVFDGEYLSFDGASKSFGDGTLWVGNESRYIAVSQPVRNPGSGQAKVELSLYAVDDLSQPVATVPVDHEACYVEFAPAGNRFFSRKPNSSRFAVHNYEGRLIREYVLPGDENIHSWWVSPAGDHVVVSGYRDVSRLIAIESN